MYQRIYDTLRRQDQGLKLLISLLDEEYDFLRERKTDEVVSLEFSVHELIRQLAVEKELIKRTLDGGKLIHYVELLPSEQGEELRSMFKSIDRAEQNASRKASRNAELSLALLDQSQRLMQELHSQIVPKSAPTYGRRGYMGTKQRPQAALISGRL